MSEIAVGLSASIIAAYDARSEANAAANRRKSQFSLTGATALAIAQDPSVRDGSILRQSGRVTTNRARTITLELIQKVAPNSPAPGAPPESTGAKVPKTVASLTFDVNQNVDGFAQMISISSQARQATHQTVVGNYVDEWGLAIGSLEVDVIVLYKAQSGPQIQAFFDLLNLAKRTTPNSGEPPSILRFHDVSLQRSLIITQNDLRFQESAEKQNQARMTISADILYDYGLDQFPVAPSTAVGAGDISVVQSAFNTSILTFE